MKQHHRSLGNIKQHVFFIVLILVLSIATVSFAATKKLNDNIKPYLGMWYYHYSNAHGHTEDRIIAIGYNYSADEYIVSYFETFDNSDVGKYLSIKRYSMTFDKMDKLYYLINEQGDIAYKLKIENGKLNYINVGNGGIETYERIK